MSGDGYNLALPFDTDDPQFRRGIEIGMLWERLEFYDGIEPVSAHVHADCAEMIIRIAEAKGLPFTAEPTCDEWLAVTIGGVS